MSSKLYPWQLDAIIRHVIDSYLRGVPTNTELVLELLESDDEKPTDEPAKDGPVQADGKSSAVKSAH